jgi:hypothetical protein
MDQTLTIGGSPHPDSEIAAAARTSQRIHQFPLPTAVLSGMFKERINMLTILVNYHESNYGVHYLMITYIN